MHNLMTPEISGLLLVTATILILGDTKVYGWRSYHNVDAKLYFYNDYVSSWQNQVNAELYCAKDVVSFIKQYF